MTRAAVTALGMKLFAPDAPAAAATAVLPPDGVDSGVIVKDLKSRFGAIITDGQGEMKGQIFRIAHLGFFDYMDTIALIGALEQVVVTSLPGLPPSSAMASSPRRRSTLSARNCCRRPKLCGRTDAACSLVHPEFGTK